MNNLLVTDFKDSRCGGLVDGIAISKSLNGARLYADYAKKSDGPFYCDRCKSEAILRVCSEKATHYAHKALKTSLVSSRDQELHNKIRDELCAYLNNDLEERVWRVEVPLYTEDETGKKVTVQPDIVGRIKPDPTSKKRPKGMPVAIEIQRSTYSIKYLFDRLNHYRKLGIHVLYIIPITKKLPQKERFRPRLFEKFLHQAYFGRVYYYDINDQPGTLCPMHYSAAIGYVPYSEFYSEGGEHQEHGDYNFIYRTFKNANWGQTVNLFRDMINKEAPAYVGGNEKRKVPDRLLMLDNQLIWWEKDEFKKASSSASAPELLDDYEFWED
ncbi:MAG TPA: hypothetical protein DIW47_06120 [Bacteroidetes bacterium]|nr:hypothetical protein [Bacteroidota bacterium]